MNQTPPVPPAIQEWVAAFAAAAAAEDRVADFVDMVDRAILEDIPELAEDAVLIGELHASTRSQFRAFLNLLDHEQMDVALPPQATALALSIARRGLDLRVLLKIYRVAQDSVWLFFTQVADAIPEDGPDHAEVLKYLWGRGGRWINEAVEQLITVYMAERDALQQGKLARRASAIEALLRGDTLSVDDTSDILGHPLRDHQTAVVLWVDDDVPDPGAAEIDAAGLQIAKALGGPRPLVHKAGNREHWLWFATRSEPDLASVRDLASELTRRTPGVHLAVGRSTRGTIGFCRSHREAVRAQRHAVSGGGNAPCVTRYADVELECLLGGDPLGAAELVRREVGGLLRRDDALEKVRETVATFLRAGGNVEQTASALIVHKNTIRYRIAQAETLIGHPLTERRTEMDLALRYLAAHPELLTSD